MGTNFPLQSIRDLRPLNKGGVIARSGFRFQDHIALGFCLEMITNPDLSEVWCETHDDITLIWCFGELEIAEFVQVKDLDLDQLWSIAKLCQREESREGTSIVEKSLAEDRCRESCKFRLVTSLGVKDELKILTYNFASPYRLDHKSDFTGLRDQIEAKLGPITSIKGNDAGYWLENTYWQIDHSTEAVMNKNLNTLSRIISGMGYEISIDYVETKIYMPLLQTMRDAAECDPDIDIIEKRICRNSIAQEIKDLIEDFQESKRTAAGIKLIEKMGRAKIPRDYIDTALEERRMFRKKLLEAQYLELSDHELIEAEILSVLQNLRLDLDMEKIEPGLPFYRICLKAVEGINGLVATKEVVPNFYYHGCMHDITDRCQHRYDRG